MKKNIIAWIFVILGALVILYSTWAMNFACNHDIYDCGFGETYALVIMAWIGCPLVLIGTLIFLVSWIVGKIKNRK